jgi:hypothetical protein
VRNRQAFAAGAVRAPGLDVALTEHMGRREIGNSSSIPELTAWLKGWDEACIAAAIA